MIETIAFDFGQVIGYFDHYRALAKLAPFTDLSQHAMYSAIFGGDLEDLFESGRITEKDFVCRLRDLCRLRCDNNIISAAVADVFWPNKPICDLIPQLKERYRLVLGSNTNLIHSSHFRPLFAETLQHFDALVLSHEIGARKPARTFFEQVIRVAQCPPERCIFIDDMPENIAGANACGLRGIVYVGADDLLGKLRRLGVASSA